jgi:hypothetical protein
MNIRRITIIDSNINSYNTGMIQAGQLGANCTIAPSTRTITFSTATSAQWGFYSKNIPIWLFMDIYTNALP